jgi:hypothetical protein
MISTWWKAGGVIPPGTQNSGEEGIGGYRLWEIDAALNPSERANCAIAFRVGSDGMVSLQKALGWRYCASRLGR